jgi:hypothetical protein
MPNLHSSHPRRGDHTEEYQAIYHEYMLKCFSKRPFMWANHIWNMFDFAADARNQGGEPGMNHKGLVTFDRKVKKDSFYLYKAHWNPEPMVHIAGKRYAYRPEKITPIKVYSNCDTVALYADGKKIGEKSGSKVFCFRVRLDQDTKVEAVAGDARELLEQALALGLDMSERTAHRIISGQIKPLRSIASQLTASEPRPHGEVDLSRTHKGMKMTKADKDSFALEMEKAFSYVSKRYYVRLSSDPKVRVSSNKITVTFEMEDID